MRGRLTALLVGAALALTLSGCAPVAEPDLSPSPSPSLTPTPTAAPEAARFALGYAAGGSLHPLEATDQSNLEVASLVYEGLYQLDGDFQAQPVLAEEASVSEDGLTWTITLGTDDAFSNGTPLTAEQVVTSLRAAKNSAVYAARLAGVSAIRAEAGAVILTLTAPNGDLPALLDVPILLETGDDLPLGTGPFAFDGGGETLQLAANPNWWQGQHPPYDTIPLYGYQSQEDRVAAFDSGQVTAVTTDFNAANALGYSGTYETHDYATTTMVFVGFNAASGPCVGAALRAALSRAFDRAEMTAILLAGHGTASALPVSPRSAQYSAAAAALLDYDLEGASALLEEAGYSYNDEGLLVRGRNALSLTLLVNRDSAVKLSLAQQLAQSLEGLGMTVTVSALDWDGYTAALAAGSFDLYLGEVKLTGDFDFSALVQGALNYGGYSSGTVSALLAAWRGTSGQERVAAAQALFEAMADDLPFAPLCFKNDSLLVRWGMVEKLSPLREHPFAGVEHWLTSSTQ